MHNSVASTAEASFGGYSTVVGTRETASIDAIAAPTSPFWVFPAVGVAVVGLWFTFFGRGRPHTEEYISMMSTSGDKGVLFLKYHYWSVHITSVQAGYPVTPKTTYTAGLYIPIRELIQQVSG